MEYVDRKVFWVCRAAPGFEDILGADSCIYCEVLDIVGAPIFSFSFLLGDLTSRLVSASTAGHSLIVEECGNSCRKRLPTVVSTDAI